MDKEEDTTVTEPNQKVITKVTRIQVRPSNFGHSLKQKAMFLGFPNYGTNCYMNASLQSLLTLREFVEDIKSQEDVLALCPEASLMRHFLDIVRYRGLANSRLKLEVIMRFKRILSIHASEFEHEGMKDAHEFLTAVLDQMRNLEPSLTKTATYMERSYICPVQRHLLFKMQNIRTCKSCGVRSIREEDFTMLSLDLIARGSVQDMLNMHQMERSLDFRCQCGGNTSGLESRFLTFPKYLILHLKRFKFTENLKMIKMQDPIILCREVVVASHQGGQQYSLVSVINHIGTSGENGHYVSDGLNPDHTLEDGTDRWLHFNDIYVFETTGAITSELCTEESYILVYQRRV